ncbi:MerR family transcriptional regulator [Nocardia sp. NPDC024068]|uniref:MerR family transcriptional regulator n=1 Tax=Nocardia sp. NPDC024068 TaxID=3157197 RepID=UPI0033CDC254
MAWSTRQLAELAGTTVRAVRHYHEVGLLEEPERGSNGYKKYSSTHLVRVLRIKRLADLGIPLSQIAAMDGAEEHPEEALRTLDAELAATIERLQRIRVELALILRQGAATDLPPEIDAVASELSAADRDYTVILTRVLGPTGLGALRELLTDDSYRTTFAAFDDLTPETDARTRSELAVELAPHVRDLLADHPTLSEQHKDSPLGAERAAHTIAVAVHDLYNEAQIDVLVQVNQLLEAERNAES